MGPEFVIPDINISVVLPQIILILSGLAILLVDLFLKGPKDTLLPLLSVVGVLGAMASIFAVPVPNQSAFNGMLLADGFSFFFNFTICLILLLTILVSVTYQRYFANIVNGEYYCLLFFAAAGMCFMAASGHLMLLFVALELMSISIYVLAGFHKDNLFSIEAALKYFLLGAFASSFLLFGFAFLFGATGTLDIIAMSRFIESNPDALGSGLLLAGIVLTVTGLGFKISMVPFHMWTPDVYEGAPTVISGFMATGVKAAAFAALIRVLMVPFVSLPVDWSMVLWVAAVLTMTVGNVLALVQENIKRMLAYSSIAHAGYLLIGFVAGTELAQAGILYYLLAYALMNMGAFGILALMGKVGEERCTLSDFYGFGLRHPGWGVAMALFMLSLAGIPPTAGFMGKLYIFAAAIKSGYIWLVIFGAVNSVISIAYYLRVIVVMYFQEPAQAPATPASTTAMTIAMGLAAAGVLILGIFPSTFWNLAQQSIFMLI